ncbi:MAG: hypothetical protein WBW81_12695 [Methylocella sp.]
MNKSACVLGSAAAAMVPSGAMAQIAPGEYSLGGIQQVCIDIPSNNWYYITFNAGGGQIFVDSNVVILYGNYATPSDTYKAVGNDNIAIKVGRSVKKADWTEWRDFFTYFNFVDDVVVSFVQTVCPPPPPASTNKPGATDPLRH